MNQLCKVCGEPAAGFHFGAFTCEGCKSFFGRTYNNIAAIAGCKHNGDCVINKKNRTACKACRLRKCLLVGMSKSGSRYGRRSNWFKIHCLLQEQQGGAGVGSGGGSSNVSNANLDQLARLQQASNQARQTYQDKTNPCIKSATAVTSAMATAAPTTASPSRPSPSLPGFLQAAKYLNEQHQQQQQQHHHHQQHRQLKLESRLSNTPSDSGASSAGDPTDDGTSVLSATTGTMRKTMRPSSSAYAGSSEADLAEQQQRRHRELLDIFRSHSEPLYSSFTPFTLPPAALMGATCNMPPMPQFKSELLFPFPAASPAEDEESEEPIDLSLRSRSDAVSPVAHSSSPPLSESANLPTSATASSSTAFVRKTTPLDLTLVTRSQTLTG